MTWMGIVGRGRMKKKKRNEREKKNRYPSLQ